MNLSRAGFYLSCATLIFAYGVAVGVYQIFPYSLIKRGLNSVETVLENRDSLIADEPVNFIAPRTRPGNGVIADASMRSDDLVLLSGFFDGLPGLQLITRNGDVLMRWPASYSRLMPDSTHIVPASDVPASDWNATVHGMELLSDGSVVFNFDGKGTVKLDRCGNVVWRLARMSHHSVHPREAGGYWIPSRYYRYDSSPYPLFELPFRDDSVLQVSDDGRVLQELMINEVLIDNKLFALLAANGNFSSTIGTDDVLHINDVEELSTEFASAYEFFEAGDLLISFRHLNLLLVLDPVTRQVRWYQSGPWHRQHDADFHADGTITVFNNNSDDTRRGEILGGSSLMRFDPFDPLNRVTTLYGDRQGQAFFTNTQGKHQELSDGHWLLVEYYAGRVFEIDATGRTVWEFINAYDEDRVARVSGAKWYPADHVQVTDWSCRSATE